MTNDQQAAAWFCLLKQLVIRELGEKEGERCREAKKKRITARVVKELWRD